jgi:hypothetical protein
MITILTTPPPNWDKLASSFKVKWEGNLVVTYAGQIHCPSGKVAPDVLVHEMVHVEQQKGKDMELLLERYMTDIDLLREVETPAFKAQAAFLEATIPDKSELWCKKYRIAKRMVEMYKDAFTFDTASAIINLHENT